MNTTIIILSTNSNRNSKKVEFTEKKNQSIIKGIKWLLLKNGENLDEEKMNIENYQ